jgi:hypothetical protein
MAKGGENTILEGINETRKPREQQLGRKSAQEGGGGWKRERGRTFLPPQTTTQPVVKSLTKEANFFCIERSKSFSLVNLSFGKNIIGPLNYQPVTI